MIRLLDAFMILSNIGPVKSELERCQDIRLLPCTFLRSGLHLRHRLLLAPVFSRGGDNLGGYIRAT